MQSFRAGAGVVWGLQASPQSGYNSIETCSHNKPTNCFNDHDELGRSQKKHLEMECLSRLEKIVFRLVMTFSSFVFVPNQCFKSFHRYQIMMIESFSLSLCCLDLKKFYSLLIYFFFCFLSVKQFKKILNCKKGFCPSCFLISKKFK